MTVVARRIIATPARSASEAWAVMVRLLAADETSDARKELESISGIVSNLIADEALADSAAVVYGSGPRVRLYCIYGEAAVSGDNASESDFAFNPTEADWEMSLPCPSEDLEWISEHLKRKSSHVTARDMHEVVDDQSDPREQKSSTFEIDREAFFKS